MSLACRRNIHKCVQHNTAKDRKAKRMSENTFSSLDLFLLVWAANRRRRNDGRIATSGSKQKRHTEKWIDRSYLRLPGSIQEIQFIQQHSMAMCSNVHQSPANINGSCCVQRELQSKSLIWISVTLVTQSVLDGNCNSNFVLIVRISRNDGEI